MKKKLIIILSAIVISAVCTIGVFIYLYKTEIDNTKKLQFSEVIKDNEVVAYSVSGIDKTKGLKVKVEIPSVYNDKPVTSIGYEAFKECRELTSITIPDSITTIGYRAFYYCNNLTNVAIPDGVTSIGSSAFEGCSKFTSIEIPSSVTIIDNKAFDCRNLEYNEDDKAYYLGNEDNPYLVLIKLKDKSITKFTINNKTKIIYNNAFYECAELQSISIPNSVTHVGEEAFRGCRNLNSVIIGDNVKTIGNSVFYDCSKLSSVEIPSSVTSIGSLVFYKCDSLYEIFYNGTMEQWRSVNVNAIGVRIRCKDGTLG